MASTEPSPPSAPAPDEPGVLAEPTEPTAPTAPTAPDRRLHPWSWLFALLSGLRQFIVPLLVLMFAGRGDEGEFWQWLPLLGVAGIALVSVWQYFTYRYRIDADSVVVRSGLLHRSLRQIPFARIHNVAINRSPLHRLFGVADVKLESAGGNKPEAHMQVLTHADALALEALVRRHAGAAAARSPSDAGTDAVAAAGTGAEPSRLLLALPAGEIVRLGLISNRGMVVLAATVALLAQSSRELFRQLLDRIGHNLFGYARSHAFDVLDYLLAAVGLVLGLVLLLRLLSISLAFVQYHGFRLEQSGRRLTVERGLFSRLRSSAPRRRIQAWTLVESVLHRLFGRRSLRVDSAVTGGSGGEQQQRGLRELAPVASPAQCDALVQVLLPTAQWPPTQWQSLHPRAWWRLALPGAVWALLLAVVLGWHFGAWGLLGVVWLGWAVFVARQHARRAGFSFDGNLIAVRGGWWSRYWRWAEVDKLQALRLSRGPLDRRLGMASLWLDTAGAGSGAAASGPPLQIRFLPVAQAEALLARLQQDIARRPLRW